MNADADILVLAVLVWGMVAVYVAIVIGAGVRRLLADRRYRQLLAYRRAEAAEAAAYYTAADALALARPALPAGTWGTEAAKVAANEAAA